MKLSSDSSRVAILDTPVKPKYVSRGTGIPGSGYYYEIGDFLYNVYFFNNYQDGWFVAFGIEKALGTIEEQVRAWSQLLRRKVPVWEAEYYADRENIPDSIRFGVTGSGGAYKVLSAVISAIRDFRGKHPGIECIHFTADEEHESIYRALLKRYSAYFRVARDEPYEQEDGKVIFKICFYDGGD